MRKLGEKEDFQKYQMTKKCQNASECSHTTLDGSKLMS